jgi:hypothetical protein
MTYLQALIQLGPPFFKFKESRGRHKEDATYSICCGGGEHDAECPDIDHCHHCLVTGLDVYQAELVLELVQFYYDNWRPVPND